MSEIQRGWIEIQDSFGHGLAAQVHEGIRQRLAELELNWLIAHGGVSGGPALGSLPLRGVVGLFRDEEAVEPQLARGVPVVNVSSWDVESDEIWHFAPDDASIGRLAADHARRHGYAAGLFLGPMVAEPARRRGAAFAEALISAGIPVSLEDPWPDRIVGVQTDAAVKAAGLERLRERVATLQRPLCVFAMVDFYAALMRDLCVEVGWSVPDEIGILGVENDIQICEAGVIGLSSIVTPGGEIGREAADLFARLAAGETIGDRVRRFPSREVVQRQSSERIGCDDEVVNEAIDLIQAYACGDWSVEDLVRILPISRRPLERRFRKAQGRTLGEAIAEVRVARAKELLADPTVSLSGVARSVGIKSAQYFATLFRKHVGCSPREYRERL